jgi:glycosyltransferase involved in cell wall biosynthesis
MPQTIERPAPIPRAGVRFTAAKTADSPRTTEPDGRKSIPQIGKGRRIALVAVHHVHIGGQVLTGGAEKYIQLAIDAFLRVGATVHVGYSGDSIYDDLLAVYGPEQLTVERTNWLDANLSGDARLNLGTVLRRRRWLKSVGADTLFVVQQAGGLAFINCLIAAKSLGLRVTTSIRQSPEPIPPATEKRWLGHIPALGLWRRRLLWRVRLPARCADAIIFNSHRVADAFAQQYALPRDRFYVIRNGEPAFETTGPRYFHDNSPKIASVGRVTSAKGADTLLEAFSTVVQRIPNVQLTYFGDGPLVPELKKRARDLGVSDRVLFAGYQSDRDQIYRDVDVCVQPSRRESMSNSVIEAMARGIPCVVSSVGGMPEAVVDGESGFVVPPGEPAAFAKAITRLLSNQEKLHQFSAAAARRARSLFDPHEFRRATVAAVLGV